MAALVMNGLGTECHRPAGKVRVLSDGQRLCWSWFFYMKKKYKILLDMHICPMYTNILSLKGIK